MKALRKAELNVTQHVSSTFDMQTAIANSWSRIAPFWPLKNLIAVNPLAGFEDLPFEEGLKQGKAYFQQKDLPEGMHHVNRESIKWLQAFFDEGQSTLQMPGRNLGLLKSTLSLFRFDKRLHKNDLNKTRWLENLPDTSEAIIAEALVYLGVPVQMQEQFFTLMLTTLPGWAAHIQYRTTWADATDADHPCPVTQSEYIAFRLVITCLVWPGAKALLLWHMSALQTSEVSEVYTRVTADETAYQANLINQISTLKKPTQHKRPQAQLVFCIDVRSEPFRRALEAQGDYETYGFAGFFGVPVSIKDSVTGETHASCPVLLKPAHNIVERPNCSDHACTNGHKRLQGFKKLYQSLKYTFTTPFSLVETMGGASGLWMGLKSFFPTVSSNIQSTLKRFFASDYTLFPDIQSIPFEQQISYGRRALKMMGLTENFAPLVVFCGHGSTTQNNAYATALDCGACGGHPGAPNARILATILNDKNVRKSLEEYKIVIPEDTLFLAAEHNTTTDAVEIYSNNVSKSHIEKINDLKKDLDNARHSNNQWRLSQLEESTHKKLSPKGILLRSKDWAQVRPEWGLARNAAFIVGPRWLTKDVNLEGRVFLHSYEWEKDSDGAALTTILTAPMVVAQWINAQYFFSTLDNVAFGGGSKITKNITGKIGIMQGNSSDLMHGLPLQSVFKSDDEHYHKPMRLTVIVHAPRAYIGPIIQQPNILKKLFRNGWVHLICNDPTSQQNFKLNRDLIWCSLSA